MSESQKQYPRVIIAAEVRLYREGLANFLGQDGRLDVVSTCSNAGQTLEQAERLRPDAVLLDTRMMEMFKIVHELVERIPPMIVIALDLNETEEEILPCVESGVSGYVCRDGSVNDLVCAVFAALNQELICSVQIAAAMRRRLARLACNGIGIDSAAVLTRREHQIAQRLNDGLSNKEIAASLHITVSTVKNHVHSVLEKLNARTRLEAATKFRHLSQSLSFGGC